MAMFDPCAPGARPASPASIRTRYRFERGVDPGIRATRPRACDRLAIEILRWQPATSPLPAAFPTQAQLAFDATLISSPA
jgi:hypothetical protein